MSKKVHLRLEEISILKIKTKCGIIYDIPIFNKFFRPNIISVSNINLVTCKKCLKHETKNR